MGPAAQPWLLLGGRRRHALEKRIRDAVERWAGEWAVAPGSLSVTVESSRSSSSPGMGRRPLTGCGVRAHSGEWLATLSSLRAVAAWAAGGTATEPALAVDVDEHSIAAGLERHLLESLWAAVTMGGAVAGMSVVPLDAERLELANGGLGRQAVRLTVTCQVGSDLIELRLAPLIVSTLLAEPRVARSGARLLSRRAAITQVTVIVECQLGVVPLTVRDLHSLKPGDVLVTDVPLDGRAQLRIGGKNQTIALGTIADNRGRRSLVVEELRRGLNR